MKHPKEVYRSLASELMCDTLLAFWQTATTSNSLKPLSADFSLLLIPKVASQTVVSQVVQWIDADDTAFVEKYYVKQKQIALNVIFLVLLLQDWFPACLQDNISFDFPFYEKLKLRVRDSAECTNAHLLVIFMYLLIMCYIVFHFNVSIISLPSFLPSHCILSVNILLNSCCICFSGFT